MNNSGSLFKGNDFPILDHTHEKTSNPKNILHPESIPATKHCSSSQTNAVLKHRGFLRHTHTNNPCILSSNIPHNIKLKASKRKYRCSIPNKIIMFILSSSKSTEQSDNENTEFLGYFMDCRASLSIMWKHKFQAYSKKIRYAPYLNPSDIDFRLGNTVFRIHGSFNAISRLPNNMYLEFEVDVVDGYFPLPVGLESMCSYDLITYYGLVLVSGQMEDWRTSIHDHPQSIKFYCTELERFHLHFQHPTSEKLYGLVKDSRSTKQTRKQRKYSH